MADEPAKTPVAAAPSSSSPPVVPSAPAAPAAPAAASPPTPEPSKTPAAAPARPTYVRDDEWDAVNNKIIEDKLAGRINGLTAFEAAEQTRKLTVPAPEKYEVKLPADFKAPEGLTVEFKQDDPLIAQARAIANKRGLDQEGFSEFLGLYAATKVGEQQQFKAAFDAEVGKLGANATARVTAVQVWLRAMGGADAEPLAKVLEIAPVAGTIVALENLMKRFSGQGAAAFTQSGRESGEVPMTEEKWKPMSYAEQRAYGKSKGKAAA